MSCGTVLEGYTRKDGRFGVRKETRVRLQRGAYNAITDVPGVRVGHVTLVAENGPLRVGRGPVRTGVTAIVPPGELREIYDQKFVAAVHVINGFGKAVGLAQVAELGRLETPILLTSTLSVWRASDALIDVLLDAHEGIGVTAPTVNPVVGECNDGWLNDIRGRHLRPEHIKQALMRAASGPVAEGSVGAGTGMVSFGYKGGIGTSSRVWPSPLSESGQRSSASTITLGVLVLANFGRREDLRIAGFPVGRLLMPAEESEHEAETEGQSGDTAFDRTLRPAGEGGSVIVVLATDAPLTSRQLGRIARRAAAGLARTGTVYWHGSGDFVLAFSTARALPPYLPDEGNYLNPFFQAAADATEEAVIRALIAARPMTGRDGHHVEALPVDRVRRMLAERGIDWDVGSI
ncbi:MAG: P1 family peptidase [Hydrogenibacillus sp.]|nr:P1 family peptidase [Hydrogenibacillus sp.]